MAYDQTTISIPQETKRKVRILAAEMGISMGKAALKLIEMGLEDHLQNNSVYKGQEYFGEGVGDKKRESVAV